MVGLIPRNVSAVVFDLDGTLVHSAPDIVAHLNTVLREEGELPFSEFEGRRFIGAGASRLIADAFAARGRQLSQPSLAQLTARYLEIYRSDGSPRTKAFPGASDVLAELRNSEIGVAICTNKAEAITDAVLRQFGLAGLVAAVVGSDSGFGRKPEAGPLLECSRRLSVRPEKTLLVGDTAIDVGAARAAGAAVALMRHGYSQVPVEGLGADAVLDGLDDLPALIRPSPQS